MLRQKHNRARALRNLSVRGKELHEYGGKTILIGGSVETEKNTIARDLWGRRLCLDDS